MKGFVRRRNGSFKLADINVLIREGLAAVKMETCEKYVQEAARWEEYFAKVDNVGILEASGTVVEPVAVPLNDSSDDEDDEESELC